MSYAQYAKISSVLPNKNEYWIDGAFFAKDDDEGFINYINADNKDLNFILREIQLPHFYEPQKLPSIPNFQARGNANVNVLESFINENYLNREKKEKQMHNFLYIISGSGIGKTWFGKYAAHHISEILSTEPLIYIPIDFSNGDKWRVELDNTSPEVSLGVRVAARYIFRMSASEFYTKNHVSLINNLQYFQFATGNIQVKISIQF